MTSSEVQGGPVKAAERFLPCPLARTHKQPLHSCSISPKLKLSLFPSSSAPTMTKEQKTKKKLLLWDLHRYGWTVTGKKKQHTHTQKGEKNKWVVFPRKKPVINYKRRDADGLNRLSLGKAAGSKEKWGMTNNPRPESARNLTSEMIRPQRERRGRKHKEHRLDG